MKLFAKALVLVLLSATLLTPLVLAADDEQTYVTLEKNEVINRDYFAAADTVRLSGTVNGDAYVAGGMVTVDGVVNGDLLVAGGTVEIRGTVKNDVRAVGGNIVIAAPVGGNVTAGGGNITVHPDGAIKGSLLSGSGNLELSGPVGKNVTAGAGNIIIDSIIGGDMLLGADELSTGSNAKITGDVTYWAERQARIGNNAVAGNLTFNQMKESESKPKEMVQKSVSGAVSAAIGAALAMVIVGGIIIFAAGLIMVAVLPKFSEKTVKTIGANAWGSFGLGFAAVIVILILSLIAFLTVIGIPAGLFLVSFLGLLCMAGHIYGALFLGKTVLVRFGASPHHAWQLLTGLIILFVLTLIPVLGWLTRAIIVTMGTGAVLTEKYAVYKEMRKRHIV